MTKGKVICETHLHTVVYSRFWGIKVTGSSQLSFLWIWKIFIIFSLKYKFFLVKYFGRNKFNNLGTFSEPVSLYQSYVKTSKFCSTFVIIPVYEVQVCCAIIDLKKICLDISVLKILDTVYLLE